MSYPNGTILTADVDLDPIEGPDGEDAPNPLNRVKVIGPSPVSTSSVAEWNGVGGHALVVQPMDTFGANQTVPVAILQNMYSVESIGETLPTTRTIDPVAIQRELKSPEQVFAEMAKAAGNIPAPPASPAAEPTPDEKAAAIAVRAKTRKVGRPKKDAAVGEPTDSNTSAPLNVRDE